MNQKKAMEYMNKLLFGLQRARSMSKEGIGDDELANRVLVDLFPWLHGKNGDAFLNSVEKVCTRGQVTGMEFYNFMTILHILDPAVNAMVGTVTETMFPEPSPSMIMEIE